jgi:hypothetical protein
MPQFYENGVGIQHPLEQLFNASGWDILSAIERGFRAQVDVKGKLAELFLYRHLHGLAEGGLISDLSWRDQDGIPDFGLEYAGRKLQMECKNVRSGDLRWKSRRRAARSEVGRAVATMSVSLMCWLCASSIRQANGSTCSLRPRI